MLSFRRPSERGKPSRSKSFPTGGGMYEVVKLTSLCRITAILLETIGLVAARPMDKWYDL